MYTITYFINKFQAIPEDKWCINTYNRDEKCCALGHCGVRLFSANTDEANALADLFNNHNLVVAHVNDGNWKEYPQPTPKQRILAALEDIKRMQSKGGDATQIKEIIRYVSVPETISKELVLN